MFHRVLFKAALAATLAIGMGGAALAAPVKPKDPKPGPIVVLCSTAGLTTSIACEGEIMGNDQDTYGGNGVVNVNDIDGIEADGLDTGLFGINTWEEAARIDEPASSDGILSMTYAAGLKSGTWTVSSWDGIAEAMLVVKGSNGFIAYLIDITAGLTGNWTTDALLNNGGQQPEISHLTLYTTPAAIPLPAGLPLLLAGLGALALLRRRKA